MGQHCLTDRNGKVADQPRIDAGSLRIIAHRLQHALRGVFPSRCGQRHHPVRQGERRLTIANPGLGFVCQFDPASARFDAMAG
jgi:hypothetical protein